MNKELEESLVSIIKESAQSVKSGVGFLSQQIPDVINQFLMWELYKSTIYTIITLASFCFMWRFSYKLYKSDRHDKEFECAVIMLISVIPFVSFINCGLEVVKILVAPKLYLIEYAAALIKH